MWIRMKLLPYVQLFAYKNSVPLFPRSFCITKGHFSWLTNAGLSTTNNLLETNEPFRIKRANIFYLPLAFYPSIHKTLETFMLIVISVRIFLHFRAALLLPLDKTFRRRIEQTSRPKKQEEERVTLKGELSHNGSTTN